MGAAEGLPLSLFCSPLKESGQANCTAMAIRLTLQPVDIQRFVPVRVCLFKSAGPIFSTRRTFATARGVAAALWFVPTGTNQSGIYQCRRLESSGLPAFRPRSRGRSIKRRGEGATGRRKNLGHTVYGKNGRARYNWKDRSLSERQYSTNSSQPGTARAYHRFWADGSGIAPKKLTVLA